MVVGHLYVDQTNPALVNVSGLAICQETHDPNFVLNSPINYNKLFADFCFPSLEELSGP